MGGGSRPIWKKFTQSIARGNKLLASAVRGRLADRLKAAQTRAVRGLTVML